MKLAFFEELISIAGLLGCPKMVSETWVVVVQAGIAPHRQSEATLRQYFYLWAESNRRPISGRNGQCGNARS